MTYEDLADRLRQEGLTILEAGGFCPVQIEGRLPHGEWFYFRSRWDQARLDVWEDGDSPLSFEDEASRERFRNPDWTAAYSDPGWDMFDAGCLDAPEAEAVLRQLMAQYFCRS